MNAFGGFLVAVGTAASNGCTSGHGICGLGRFSLRSLASVCTFCSIGVLTASVISAVADKSVLEPSYGTERTEVSELLSNLCTYGFFGLSLAIFAKPASTKNFIPVIISAFLFTLGLVISGMSNPEVVRGFLNLNVEEISSWNATLCFVMAFGVLISVLTYQYRKKGGANSSCEPKGCGISKKGEKTSIDLSLVGGSCVFGIGWGLSGVCPGPMIVSIANGSPTAIFAFLPSFIFGRVLFARLKRGPLEKRVKGEDLTHPEFDQIITCGVDTSGVPQGVRSWLSLVPPEASTTTSIEGVTKENEAHVLVASDSLNTQETAAEVCRALDSLPRPTLVQCRSGARATAASRLHLANKYGVPCPEVVSIAQAKGESWTKNAKLVEWVSSCCSECVHDSPERGLIFRQLFDKESSTYTYLLGDKKSKEAIIIDPVDTMVSRDLSIVKELGLTLIYGLNTHAHADHITGTSLIRENLPCGSFRSVISSASGAKADMKVEQGSRIFFGKRFVEVRLTPGHTAGCACFVLDDKSRVFTGDTLLVRGCGRTDFQEGSSSILYKSVHKQLFTLPGNCTVFPAHDYKGRTSSTISEEIAFNPRLGQNKTEEEFVVIMTDLKLSPPKLLDVAVPKNMRCRV